MKSTEVGPSDTEEIRVLKPARFQDCCFRRRIGVAERKLEHDLIRNWQFGPFQIQDRCLAASESYFPARGGADEITYQMILPETQLYFAAADILMSHESLHPS